MARTYQLGPARRALNLVMARLLSVGLGPRSTYLLSTTGRRSGRRRTTPVTLIETGGSRWLVSPYGQVGWVQNVHASPVVELRRGRTRQRLHVTELGAREAGPVLQAYLRHVGVTAPFFDARASDPVSAFVAEAPRHPVFLLSADHGAAVQE